MALTKDIENNSLNNLLRDYDNQLNKTDKILLKHINDIAAIDDIALNRQNQNIIDLLVQDIKESKSAENRDRQGTAFIIYAHIKKIIDLQTVENKNRHLIQGQFDQSPVYKRAERDQMQDHDMTIIMPKPHGNILVLGVVNNHDDHSANSILEFLASELFNPDINHIIIPVGPGHWRGIYLTKPKEDKEIYELELFDPYGPHGAAVLDEFTLNLLEQCGLTRDLIHIRHSGPIHPQGDAYSCGDFTCAYSHKKMMEFGAPKDKYDEVLINTLDNFGNEDNALRFAIREATQTLLEGKRPPVKPVDLVVTVKPVKTSEEPVKPELPSEPKKPKIQEPYSETPKSQKLSPGARLAIEAASIGGASIIGAVIGGLIGFFVLPVLGAIAGAAIGAGIGTLVSLVAVGLGRIFGGTSSTVSTDKPQNVKTGSETNSIKSTLKKVITMEKEPKVHPPLFTRPSKPKDTFAEPSKNISLNHSK